MKNKKSVIRYVPEFDTYVSTGLVDIEELEDFEPERETTKDVFEFITQYPPERDEEDEDDAETPG